MVEESEEESEEEDSASLIERKIVFLTVLKIVFLAVLIFAIFSEDVRNWCFLFIIIVLMALGFDI